MTHDNATVQWEQSQPGLRGLIFEPFQFAVRPRRVVTDTGQVQRVTELVLPCGDFSHYRRQRGIHRA